MKRKKAVAPMNVIEASTPHLYLVKARVRTIAPPVKTERYEVSETMSSDTRTFFMDTDDVEECLRLLKMWAAERKHVDGVEVVSCKPVAVDALLMPRDGMLFSCIKESR